MHLYLCSDCALRALPPDDRRISAVFTPASGRCRRVAVRRSEASTCAQRWHGLTVGVYAAVKVAGAGASDAKACEAFLATSMFYGRIRLGYKVEMSDQDDNVEIGQPGLDELISLNLASKLSGLSPDHLRRLAGRGDLRAKKIGRDWLTTMRAVDEYLARDRHPGPKKHN